MLPSSGRLRAAAMNLVRFWLRKSGSFPARSSNIKVKPHDAPTPGIAGGGKEKAMPSVTPASFLFKFCLMASYCSSGALRSAQSFSVIQKKELYVFWTPLNMLYPTTEVTECTPGVFEIMPSITREASLVRCRDDALGSCNPANTYP